MNVARSVLPASSRTYYGVGLLAIVGALAVFPYWEDFFHFEHTRAVPVAILNGVWLALLFISTVHVWQGASRSVLGAGMFIACLSAALSGFWLLVFYPAVLSYDAIWQWQQALSNQYSQWHPPAMAMLMHATQYWSRDPSLFSFVQGLLFWGCMFCLIRQVAGSDRQFLVQCGIMAMVPPLWLYSNAMVSNTWTAAFMMLSATLLLASIRTNDRRLFVGAVLALSVAVMFRRESALLMLVLMAARLWSFGPRRGGLRCAADILLIIVVIGVPSAVIAASPRVEKSDATPAGLGFLSYYVGLVANSRDSLTEAEFDRERQAVDREFGAGTLDDLLDRYVCYSSSYIAWKRGEEAYVPERRNQIRRVFTIGRMARLARRHPLGLIKHRMCYVAYLTQFSALDYQEWGVIERNQNMDRRRVKLNFQVDSDLPSVKERYRWLMKGLLGHPIFSLIARHYVFLIGAALALVLGVLWRKVELVVPSLFALVYPLAFVLAGPATPWRYLLPAYVLAWIAVLAAFSDLVVHEWSRPASRSSPARPK